MHQPNPSPLPDISGNIAVIGAGLAGTLSAIYLARTGYNVILIDKAKQIMTVSSKIPIHLHSGGLYLNDMTAAKHCLHDSINFVKALPFALVPHPTAFAVMTLDDTKELKSGHTQLMEEAMTIYNKEHPLAESHFNDPEYNEKAKKEIHNKKLSIDALALKAYIEEKPHERQTHKEFPSELKAHYHAVALKKLAYALYLKNREKNLSTFVKNIYKTKAIENQKAKWVKMKERFNQLKEEYERQINLDPENKTFGEPVNFFKIYEVDQLMDIKRRAQKRLDDPNDKDGWIEQLARITDVNQVHGIIMSSEVGLNMIRTAAGLEHEINEINKQWNEQKNKQQNEQLNQQKKDYRKINFLKGVEVTDIKILQNGGFEIFFKQDGVHNPKSIKVVQVVNATGYRGKILDDKMGFTQDWIVDVKGAGIIQLNDDTFHHIPGVFFTEAKGMAHLSCFNEDFAGINYTTVDVEGTYVKDGVIIFDKSERLDSSPGFVKLEKEIINKSITDPSLIMRTEENIKGCARFMPELADREKITAVGYAPGSLGLLGKDKNIRESKEVYLTSNGYHAVNLAKGGGGVSAAMTLVHEVIKESEKYSLPIDNPFKEKSHTIKFPQKYIINYSREIDAIARERANSLTLPERVSFRYNGF